MDISSVSAILFLVQQPGFCREGTHALPLFGKPLEDWVRLSLGTIPCKAVPYEEGADTFGQVVPHLTDADLTVVLFSDTPLLQHATVLEALQLAMTEERPVLALTRGFVLRTADLSPDTDLDGLPCRYLSSEDDFLTAVDFERLAFIGEVMRQRILQHHMREGVHIIDPATTYIDGDTVIGARVTIHSGNHLRGKTVVGDDVTLYENNVIDTCILAPNAAVTSSRLTRAFIGARTTVGPFAYIRPETAVGDDCRVGDFVEIKRSKIGNQCKIAHLAYIGDCEMGEGCNIGCGAVTVNYDGREKHKTVLGNHVFLGSNCNVVAPITLSDYAYVAAGSTLTEPVPARALAIARARQITKPDWIDPDEV
jgi:bifunctional N-acetylglucosamine-1-phosphate-uridyltransferase/glucosamine-1-phosphate-acetyltransferase GlmU-like protein